MLVNPPAPDGGIWIRSQHRVGRRSRENMVWPQVSLAQMAALLVPPYTVKIVDAIAERMSWPQFIELLDRHAPKFYVTQVTAPTLENDMYGTFIAKSRGARTIAFGTHVTPLPRETMRSFPSLDFGLVGEPELTLRDLIDVLAGRYHERTEEVTRLFSQHDPTCNIQAHGSDPADLSRIKGLAWRRAGEIVVNEARPFIADLDDLPLPKHELLPLHSYRMPMLKGPFTFIVPSRGCPAACTYCIKHVTYQNSVRTRSPQNVLRELWNLKKLGLNNVHMYADLFTVNREQVLGICQRMIDEKIQMQWTCNSRVDFVDEELLLKMAQAGCHLIAWGIESGNEQILKHARKGANPAEVQQSLTWAKNAGIKNWGYFIIGLPGETESTIRQTIDFAKSLPLDIALFHIAAPYPGTPFFFEVIKNGWFRPGTKWEQVDMDAQTVLDYRGMSAERLQYWQKRAFREWALRPGPLMTVAKMLCSDVSTARILASVLFQHVSWFANAPKKT
jgi:anaerobic magnesium-protoporphyrin IX monomethyl ester cyclase